MNRLKAPALLLAACCFFLACAQQTVPEPPEPVAVTVNADYDHPFLHLDVHPPQAAQHLVPGLVPRPLFNHESSPGQVTIELLDNWDYQREYIVTLQVASSATDEFYLEKPFSFTFQTPPARFDLVAVGDVMLDKLTSRRLRHYDTAYPMKHIRHITSSGDLNFANLESPLSDRGTPASKRYVFRGRPEAVEVLLDGGFNLVSLANNHILDYGVKAMADTISILDDHDIAHVGAGMDLHSARQGYISEINGVKVAVLAYTRAAPMRYYPAWQAEEDKPGTMFYYRKDLVLEDLERVRQQADVVIVSVHWGNEYTHSVTQEQVNMGRLLVDNGADLVLGHHSHAPQGIEFYQGKPIVYGLGNFIFYPFRIPICDETYIFRATLGRDGVETIRLTPVLLGDSQPFVPQRQQLERLQQVIGSLMDQFGTGWEIDGQDIVIEVP